MIKRILLSLLLVVCVSFLTPTNTYASHLMGGEITWVCLPSGAFKFKMILYRDCNGVPGPASTSLQTNAPAPGGTIPLVLQSQTDVSPVGIGCTGTCASPSPFGGNVEEFIYESLPVFLTGVPPAGGWWFAYDNCCRNA
ncbi:MAG: hypothetical protein HKN22_01250, partial [Bacteroidia bacterium]|nr:hypothetical protein [Bacteroidia bacterium]